MPLVPVGTAGLELRRPLALMASSNVSIFCSGCCVVVVVVGSALARRSCCWGSC